MAVCSRCTGPDRTTAQGSAESRRSYAQPPCCAAGNMRIAKQYAKALSGCTKRHTDGGSNGETPVLTSETGFAGGRVPIVRGPSFVL